MVIAREPGGSNRPGQADPFTNASRQCKRCARFLLTWIPLRVGRICICYMQLKKLVADVSLYKAKLQDVAGKK